jgi:hypothetical protein
MNPDSIFLPPARTCLVDQDYGRIPTCSVIEVHSPHCHSGTTSLSLRPGCILQHLTILAPTGVIFFKALQELRLSQEQGGLCPVGLADIPIQGSQVI